MDLDLFLRTSGLLLAALILTHLLSRATAATRHLIWHTAIVAVLLAPAIILVTPRFEIGVPTWISASLESPAVRQSSTESEVVAPCDSSTASGCLPGEIRLNALGLGLIARFARAGTWIVGAWFLLGWLASGWQATRATDAPLEWVADARRLAARLGFRQMPHVRRTRGLGSPRVAGLFRPVILLPTSAHEWSSADREAALLHELSHIRRADRRTQALAQFVCALYWFNPLTWIAARALARERECACDDEVLKAGVRPSAYASLLLDLAKGQHTWTPAAALGMARPSTIEGRLLAILASDVETTPLSPSSRRLTTLRSTRWLVIAGSIVVVATVLGAQQQRPATAAEGSARESTKMVGPKLMSLDAGEDASPITKALTRALDDPDRQVREQAALGLALVPGTETIDPLLTALNDSDAQVREKAAIGLAFRRDARVVDPLLKAMDDTDAQVREKVAIALGASGDPRAMSALERALSDPDAQVREKAASGLILLGLRK
jgi:beta-lactamase regulating signal transducer with metallopeptidase domain